MEQKTVSPPERAGCARLAEEFWQDADAPIYDAVERQWLAEGREGPVVRGLSWGRRGIASADDLFRGA